MWGQVRLPCVCGPMDGVDYVQLPHGVPLIGTHGGQAADGDPVHVYVVCPIPGSGGEAMWSYVGMRKYGVNVVRGSVINLTPYMRTISLETCNA